MDDMCCEMLDKQISKIIDIEYHYNLLEIFSEIDSLPSDKQDDIYNKMINNYLRKIKNNGSMELFDKYQDDIDDVCEFYDYSYYYEGDNLRLRYLEHEADEITNDLIFKLFNDKGRELLLPIDYKYIIQFSVSSNISAERVKMIIWWIIMRLSVIYNFTFKK